MPGSSSSLRHKALYVEDHAVNVLLMRAMFERIPDCQLVVADCGGAALDLARDLHPALLLLDLRLPDVHGVELLPLLRRVAGCEHAPAVAVTAEHGFDITGTGFDELWRKPLDLTRTVGRVQALVALAAARREAASLELPPLTTPSLVARWAARL